ncbi:MAG: hypothetical protein Ct9H300mP31_09470 [Acidimicrobiaceae bacterium]|nr:MAG: hypothetical protein Ct9H300mP31_09470 [Acidimicrobiaceae bacterium]
MSADHRPPHGSHRGWRRQRAPVGDATLTWYQRTPTIRYGFCSTCGATLFWSAADKEETLTVAAGTLDQPTGLRTVLAMYADEAADYHRLDDALETHGGELPLD